MDDLLEYVFKYLELRNKTQKTYLFASLHVTSTLSLASSTTDL